MTVEDDGVVGQLLLRLVGVNYWVVVAVRRTRCEYTCAANEGGGEHPKFLCLSHFFYYMYINYF